MGFIIALVIICAIVIAAFTLSTRNIVITMGNKMKKNMIIFLVAVAFVMICGCEDKSSDATNQSIKVEKAQAEQPTESSNQQTEQMPDLSKVTWNSSGFNLNGCEMPIDMDQFYKIVEV